MELNEQNNYWDLSESLQERVSDRCNERQVPYDQDVVDYWRSRELTVDNLETYTEFCLEQLQEMYGSGPSAQEAYRNS